MIPQSRLTVQRPDIWQRGLALATGLTGYSFPSKLPVRGVIQACGGWGGRLDNPPKNPEERIEELKRHIEIYDRFIKKDPDKTFWRTSRDNAKREIEKIKKEQEEKKAVAVPEGAMEFLLHEVGHWVSATDSERLLPSYGLIDEIAGIKDGFEKIVVPTSDLLYEREWQAWAFEEIILAPFGPSRNFASPTWRDGVAFTKSGPIPDFALRHAERSIASLGIDIEQWRAVYGEWVKWGYSQSTKAPWRTVQ